MRPAIDELVVTDEPGSWGAAGFRVEGGCCAAASVRIRLEGRGGPRGIARWSLRGACSLELDGLDTAASGREPAAGRHTRTASCRSTTWW